MSSTQSSQQFVAAVRERVGLVVVGQDVVVERVMIALLTGGHLLLQGMPGLAKTLLVNTVAKAIHLDFKRIQFTVDMLPSDILGSEVVDLKTGEFRIHRGPVFTNLLLADEINRAAPKVQGAMLEAMQERKVTLGGQSMKLPTPFLVIATQNPVEQSGTFELPEAQLDRFMLLHRLGYPGRDEEQDILRRQLSMGLRKEEGGAVPKTAFDMIDGSPVGTATDLVCRDGIRPAGTRQRSLPEALRGTRPSDARIQAPRLRLFAACGLSAGQRGPCPCGHSWPRLRHAGGSL